MFALTRSSDLSRPSGAAAAADRQSVAAVPPIAGSSMCRGGEGAGGLVGQIRAYVRLLGEPMQAVTAGRSGRSLRRAVRRNDDVGERLSEQHPRCLCVPQHAPLKFPSFHMAFTIWILSFRNRFNMYKFRFTDW